MGQYFRHLRIAPWNPTFKWVDSIAEAADMINRPHEDYPTRIPTTHLAIDSKVSPISARALRKTHKNVFGDTPHGGKFRKVNVRVGHHVAPKHSQVSALMKDLCDIHTHLIKADKDYARPTQALIDWYTDFETIHPFQDGNGRVGGIVVAQYSHLWFPEKGWMASQQ